MTTTSGLVSDLVQAVLDRVDALVEGLQVDHAGDLGVGAGQQLVVRDALAFGHGHQLPVSQVVLGVDRPQLTREAHEPPVRRTKAANYSSHFDPRFFNTLRFPRSYHSLTRTSMSLQQLAIRHHFLRLSHTQESRQC
jgi:hypothetical protein